MSDERLLLRPALRAAPARPEPRLCRHGHPHAGAGRRREQRHLRGGPRRSSFGRRSTPHPDRVVAVTRSTPQSQADNHAAADYLDIRRESRSFSALSAYRQDVLDMSGANGDPERVPGAQVSVSYFDVFEVPALAGRTFSERRDDPRGERLVVLGHALWQRRFGSDRAVVGKTVRINREPFTVVGVMPPGVPAARGRGSLGHGVGGRPDAAAQCRRRPAGQPQRALLRRGGTAPPRRDAWSRRGPTWPRSRATWRRATPSTNSGQGFGAVPLRELTTRDARAGLFILARGGRFRAADRVRQHREPDARPGDGPQAGAGDARGAGGRPHAPRAAVAHREPRHRPRRRGAGAPARLVGPGPPAGPRAARASRVSGRWGWT